MHRRRRLLVLLSLLVVPAVQVRAEEQYLTFLEGMYERGYGVLAIDYLKHLGARQDLPDDVRAVLDLEMGNALRVAADETQNADESAEYLSSAQKVLEKFLKEHPDNPRAAAAYVAYGDLAAQRGTKLLLKGLSTKGTVPSPLLADARAIFLEARPKYQKALELYQAQFNAAVAAEKAAAEEQPAKKPVRLRRGKAAPTAVEIAEANFLDSRFKVGSIDFNIGRTYTDPKNKDRTAAFQAAMTQFDEVYQYNRGLRVGLYAHLFHGKTADAMGDPLLAQDLYEEVLANDDGDRDPGSLEPLFAEVVRSLMIVFKAQGKLDDMVTTAEEWMKTYKTIGQRRSPGYQGVAILYAEAMLEAAKTLDPADAKKLTQDALKILKDVAAVPSPYQQEAVLKVLELGGKDIKTMTDALALGDEALRAGNWEDGITSLLKALELAKVTKDKNELAKVPETRLRLAKAQMAAGKTADALATAELYVQELPADKQAPEAGALAVKAAWNEFVLAKEKPPALERLKKDCELMLTKWPDLTEADEARIALGKVEIYGANFPKAIEVFEKVNPLSDLYSSAIYEAARVHWGLYIEQLRKPPAARDVAVMKAHQGKALEELTKSLELQQKREAAGSQPADFKNETMLLLSDIYLDAGEPANAVPLLDVIIGAMQKQKPASLDRNTQRACVSAIRAYLGVKDLKKAEGVAQLLLTVGGDDAEVNGVLLKFVGMIKYQYKQAEAALIEAKSPDPKTLEGLKAAIAGNADFLKKLVEPLGQREQIDLAGLISIGDTLADLGETKSATTVYERVLKAAEDPAHADDPKFKAALTGVRARQVGLLRTEKKYEEALAIANKLIEDNPRSLEPRMEKGRVLQEWSESEPSHFPEAVAVWTELRQLLSQLRGKKPPEYYEVIYNASYCLVKSAEATNDKTKASDAEKLLKSTLVLSPQLSGPTMVAKYNALLEKAITLQGRQPAAAAQPQAAVAN